MTEAARLGNVQAKTHLAGLYMVGGRGIKKDEKKAVTLYSEAANFKDPGARFSLACCFRDGKGVEKNLDNAIHWFKKSAAQGNEAAQKVVESYKAEGLIKEDNKANILDQKTKKPDQKKRPPSSIKPKDDSALENKMSKKELENAIKYLEEQKKQEDKTRPMKNPTSASLGTSSLRPLKGNSSRKRN